jgi:hypothetical protein
MILPFDLVEYCLSLRGFPIARVTPFGKKSYVIKLIEKEWDICRIKECVDLKENKIIKIHAVCVGRLSSCTQPINIHSIPTAEQISHFIETE